METRLVALSAQAANDNEPMTALNRNGWQFMAGQGYDDRSRRSTGAPMAAPATGYFLVEPVASNSCLVAMGT